MPAKPAPEGRTIVKEILLAAPVDVVWKALVDAEQLKRWFPLDARVEPGEGGSIFLSWGADCEGTGKIDAWEPNRRLRWLEPSPTGGAPMAVEWFLEARGGKTLLRLVHSGFAAAGADWANEYHDSVDYGWGFMFANLRLYLERHFGKPRVVAWPRQKVSLSREQAFERLTAPGGFFVEGLTRGKPGERCSLSARTGERFEGRIDFFAPPRGFCIVAENLGDSLLWATLEGSPGKIEVQLWLSAYTLEAKQVQEMGSRWQEVLQRIFLEAK
jgi:uncharacterized protein YndB with AHSA1/START domain